MDELLPVKISFSMFSNGYGLLLSGAWSTLACLLLLIFLHICGSFEIDFLHLFPLVPAAFLTWWVSFPSLILTGVSKRGIYFTSLNRQRKTSWAKTSVQRESTRKIKLQDQQIDTMKLWVQLSSYGLATKMDESRNVAVAFAADGCTTIAPAQIPSKTANLLPSKHLNNAHGGMIHQIYLLRCTCFKAHRSWALGASWYDFDPPVKSRDFRKSQFRVFSSSCQIPSLFWRGYWAQLF